MHLISAFRYQKRGTALGWLVLVLLKDLGEGGLQLNFREVIKALKPASLPL